MAKRRFRLPGVEELNKDQDGVLRLPEDGQFLVVGGPGTGKSVVALLRAMKFSDNGDYVFLTYNKVLNSATKQLQQADLNINTLLAFFNEKMCDEFCAKLGSKHGVKFISKGTYVEILNKMFIDKYPDISYEGGKHKDILEKINDSDKKIFNNFVENYLPLLKKPYDHDYQDILQKYKEIDSNYQPITRHLIIDEGQDMSVGYYDVLGGFGYENFFIVADQNQQITEENSSRQELTDFLGLEVREVIELQQNYRNSHSIALVAQHFFTDISSPKPDLPEYSKSALGMPVLYKYGDFQKCIQFILREADRDPSNLIGVVVAKTTVLDICKKQLENMEIKLDNDKSKIQSYKSGEGVDIAFDEGGIVVLNDKSIKGLEFDIVFIILKGFEIYNNEKDVMCKRLYVMSSRAIKKLVFFQSENNAITELLPDESILLRQELN